MSSIRLQHTIQWSSFYMISSNLSIQGKIICTEKVKTTSEDHWSGSWEMWHSRSGALSLSPSFDPHNSAPGARNVQQGRRKSEWFLVRTSQQVIDEVTTWICLLLLLSCGWCCHSSILRHRVPEVEENAFTMEKTPAYFNFNRAVPANIKNLVPDAKLLLLLCDPVDRVLSDFFHEVNWSMAWCKIDGSFNILDDVKFRFERAWYFSAAENAMLHFFSAVGHVQHHTPR